MNYKQVKLPPRTKFKGFDYSKSVELEMTGKEWHQYGKTETFKLASDRDNRDATCKGLEVWGVKG